jgi:hypothetical protein
MTPWRFHWCRDWEAVWSHDFVASCWPDDEAEIVGYGNCLDAMAALQGIAVEELTPAELDVCDPRYPVLIGIMCRKRDQ